MNKIIAYTDINNLTFSPADKNFLIFQGIPGHKDEDGLLHLKESMVCTVQAWDYNTLAVGLNDEMNKMAEDSQAEIKIYTQYAATAVKYDKIYNILFNEIAQDPRIHGIKVLGIINELIEGPEHERESFINNYIENNATTERSEEIKKIFDSIQARANYSIEYLPEAAGMAQEIEFYPTMQDLLIGRLSEIKTTPIPQVVVLKGDAEVKKFITTSGKGLLSKEHNKTGFNDYILQEIKAHVNSNAEKYPQAAKKTTSRKKSPGRGK